MAINGSHYLREALEREPKMSEQEVAKVYAAKVRSLAEQIVAVIDQARNVDKMYITFGIDAQSVVTVNVTKQTTLV